YTARAASHSTAHYPRHEIWLRAVDCLLDEAHHHGDLVHRPAPVLRRERVERQIVEADLGAGADRRARRLHAFAMTGHARQPAPGRPPAVAVHDDGDVARDRVLTRTHEELTLGQRAELGPRRAAPRYDCQPHSSS